MTPPLNNRGYGTDAVVDADPDDYRCRARDREGSRANGRALDMWLPTPVPGDV